MRRIICALFLLSSLSVLAHAQDKYVYSVKIAECKFAPKCSRTQTGFRIEGVKGIMTALHGVADANDIRVVGEPGAYSFEGPLKISKVDVKHDMALLTSSVTEAGPADGLPVAANVEWDALEKVTFIGRPLSVPSNDTRVRNLGNPRLKVLRRVLPGPIGLRFLERRSPDPDELVVNIDGVLLPGHSGAPALDQQGRVVAVGNGGLAGGFSQICWAIPWPSVTLEDASASKGFVNVGQMDPGVLFSMEDENKARTPEIYRVRLTVLDPHGAPISDAKVVSSLGGEALAVPGGYQFEIAGAKRPSDGKLAFFITKESAFLTGKVELVLAEDPNPAVSVSLSKDDSALVRGVVVDDSGMVVVGARVSVLGYESESVVTQSDGGFVLRAHAANGQQVLLRAEKLGFEPLRQWHMAGDGAAELMLKRR